MIQNGYTVKYLYSKNAITNFVFFHLVLGKNIAHPLSQSKAVQPARNDHTLFLVGGKDQETGESLNKVFQLVCDQTPASCKWEETEVKMKYARHGHVVLSIDESLAMALCNQ